MRVGWVPPRSPYSLIQEDLWSPTEAGEWLVLVSCMLLNCTSRRQVERVLPAFIARWNEPRSFLRANNDEVAEVCRSLGFANRRTVALKKMTAAYASGGWSHASELPGIGDYASATWEIFCDGVIPVERPRDHALVLYYDWLVSLKHPLVEQVKNNGNVST